MATDNLATEDSAVVAPSRELDTGHLHQMQRFAELGRLSASLLHEISNPLTAALLNLEQGNDRQTPAIRRARRDMQQLRRYVEAARQQLRQESAATSFCVRPQLEQLVRLLSPQARKAGVQLVVDPVPHYRLHGDPVKLQQVVANLIINAIDAYRHGVDASSARLIGVRVIGRGQTLMIRVVDWGEGIAPDLLATIFEPFYSTKSHGGHGLGIGLSLVKEYVTTDFGGTIKATSSRRHGTGFTIRLPATTCPRTAASKKVS